MTRVPAIRFFMSGLIYAGMNMRRMNILSYSVKPSTPALKTLAVTLTLKSRLLHIMLSERIELDCVYVWIYIVRILYKRKKSSLDNTKNVM
jgi:hypothetical protein